MEIVDATPMAAMSEPKILDKKAPVFPGCSGDNYEELLQCTRSKILERKGS